MLDVTALGGYEEIDRFFQRLAVSHRLADVVSLTLTATGEDQVQLATVVRFPFWPARAPLPPAPESRARPAGVPRPAADAFLRDQSLAFAKSDAIAAWRRARRNPRLFLSELSAVVRERPVVLAFASLAEEFTIRGLALGEGPLRAFESRLERGFLRVSEFLMAKQGACHRFEAHGRSPVAGPDAELPVPVEDPFEQDAQPCRVDRDAARALAVRGRAPTAKDPGRGPLTLRLRDVDLADVFQVLAALGAGSYVVDGDVAGRASVEVTRATLDETLAAIRKGAGVEIAASGTVRRVGAARAPPREARARERPAGELRPEARGGARRARRDGRRRPAARGARAAGLPGPRERLDARRAARRGAGRAPRVGRARRAHRGGAARAHRPIGNARGSGAGGARRAASRGSSLRREELTVLEFQLAGVAAAGDAFVAFAYSPTGQLYAYRVGDRLVDAQVRAVESTDVLLETDEGPLRIPLPPCPTEGGSRTNKKTRERKLPGQRGLLPSAPYGALSF